MDDDNAHIKDLEQRFVEHVSLCMSSSPGAEISYLWQLLRELLSERGAFAVWRFILDMAPRPQACCYVTEKAMPLDYEAYDTAMIDWLSDTDTTKLLRNVEVIASILRRIARPARMNDADDVRMMCVINRWATDGSKGCALIDYVCGTCAFEKRYVARVENMTVPVFESWINHWCDHCAAMVLPYDSPMEFFDYDSLRYGMVVVARRGDTNARAVKLLENIMGIEYPPQQLWCLFLAIFARNDDMYGVLLSAKDKHVVPFGFTEVLHMWFKYYSVKPPDVSTLLRWLAYVPKMPCHDILSSAPDPAPLSVIPTDATDIPKSIEENK